MQEPLSQASTSTELPQSQFPPTHWTVVLTAGHAGTTKADEALQQLCVIYRRPIYSFLVRTGHKAEQAEDLTSGFIEHLLEKNRLEGFERTDTKFRSFLLRCLQRFAHDQWRKEIAIKRGGGQENEEYDDGKIGQSPEIEQASDVDFAKEVHREAMRRLGSEKYPEGAKKERFAALRKFIWSNDKACGVSYDEVGKPLQMAANHVSKSVFDLRQNYYESFRRTVSETVARGQIDEETRYLMGLLAGSGLAAEL